MTAGELKQLVPLTDVAELLPDKRYLIRLKERLSQEEIEKIMLLLKKQNISGVVLDAGASLEPLQEGARYVLTVDKPISCEEIETLHRIAAFLKDQRITIVATMVAGVRLEVE